MLPNSKRAALEEHPGWIPAGAGMTESESPGSFEVLIAGSRCLLIDHEGG